jgi:hypothetical protein
MSTIVTRAGKGSPLTNTEVDSNFTNLNTDKIESVTSADGSIVVLQTGTNIDLAVSAASPASTLLAAVRNTTGATLTKGTAVYISGATGQISTVSKALATGDATSAQTLGLITSDLANNSNGYVTVIGLVANINTSAYTDGQQLYLSPTTAGTLTSTKPYAPQHLVYVAIVEYAHPTQGKLFVKVQNGYEMDELHNVSAQSPTTGQTLVYNASTSLWEKSFAPVISGTTINNTPVGATTPSTGKFTGASVTTATGQSTFNENDTITGWIYSGNSFSVAAQESAPQGLFIKPDGLKMYVNGSTGDDVNEYSLSTAWDIATATFVRLFSTATEDTSPADIFFKPDGLTMFIMGGANDIVYQYTLTVAWDISSASYASKSFSVTTQETSPQGLWFKPDGLVMYIVGNGTDSVYQYALSTAWDVSTASYASIFYSVASQEAGPVQVNLSADGLKMWITGQSGDDIWEYTLATAWNVSTATPVNNFYTGFQDGGSTGLFIDSTAPNRVYLVGTLSDTIYQYYTAANSLKLDTQKLYVDGLLSVNGNFEVGENAYVDGVLTVQGTSNFSATNISGTFATSGATTFSGTLTSSSTTTLATSTATQTVSLGAGATVSGATKTINIGTTGVSGSTTTIAIGSAVSGSLGSIAIQSPTVNIGQTATQFAVTNTASAVNYVNITGAATGVTPTISGQGSDSNVGVTLASKGVASVILMTNSQRQFDVYGPTSAVNYIRAAGATAGNAVSFTASGTDTNIDLTLTPKGTGNVRFGTYTGTILTPTGYVEIKDSGGTVRRLLVG